MLTAGSITLRMEKMALKLGLSLVLPRESSMPRGSTAMTDIPDKLGS